MVIRRLNVGEGVLFKAIRLRALKESPEAFSSSYQCAMERSDASWSEQSDSSAEGNDRFTFIACEGDEVIALAAFYRLGEDSSTGELLQMWAAPSHRGTTLAGDLLSHVCEVASSHGYLKILAEVYLVNQRAVSFYKKLDFHEEATREGEDATSISMIKIL